MRARTQDQVVLVEPVHGEATAVTIKVAAGFGDRLVRLCRRGPRPRLLALDAAAPRARRALADRPRLGGDQPAGPGDAAVHDDRLQQGHQPRRPADPGRAGDRDGHAGRLRAAAARAARLHHRPYRRQARGRDRQRRVAPHPASALSLLRGDARCRRARTAAAGRPAAPVPDRPPAAAVRRSRLRRACSSPCCSALNPALALVTAAAMPVFAALSILGQRGQAAHQRAHAPGCQRQGHRSGRGRDTGAHRQVLALEPDMQRRYERHLRRAAPGPGCNPAGSATSPPASARRCSI